MTPMFYLVFFFVFVFFFFVFVFLCRPKLQKTSKHELKPEQNCN